MKNLLLILMLGLSINPIMSQKMATADFNEVPNFTAFDEGDVYEAGNMNPKYQQGWEDGYCEGFKDIGGIYAICPPALSAPIPMYDRQGYVDGYNRGFKKGYIDAYDFYEVDNFE